MAEGTVRDAMRGAWQEFEDAASEAIATVTARAYDHLGLKDQDAEWSALVDHLYDDLIAEFYAKVTAGVEAAADKWQLSGAA